MDFHSARIWAREIIEEALTDGAVAIDATMGNGNDTQWLCELVGENGHVYAFDVQREAVDKTTDRLTQANLLRRATLFVSGHENMAELVSEKADAIVFNLGWLPGAKHMVTTRVDTTLTAVNAGLGLLREGAVMTICAYPGHEEGAREKEALLNWAASLDPTRFDAILKAYVNQPNDPPCMIAIQKRRQKHRQ